MDIEKELSALEANPNMLRGLNDARQVPALILLTRAVLKLDSSSAKLAQVNIWLAAANALFAVILIAIGVIQVVLMIKGR